MNHRKPKQGSPPDKAGQKTEFDTRDGYDLSNRPTYLLKKIRNDCRYQKEIIENIKQFLKEIDIPEKAIDKFINSFILGSQDYNTLQISEERKNFVKEEIQKLKDITRQNDQKKLSKFFDKNRDYPNWNPNRQKDSNDNYIKQQLSTYVEGNCEIVQEVALRKILIKVLDQKLSGDQLEVSHEDLDYIKSLKIKIQGDEEAHNARQFIKQKKDLIKNLNVFIRHYCGIDIKWVINKIQQGRRKSSENHRLVQFNQESNKVILFFGNTKSGKSTIITRLLGFQLQEIKIQGISTLQPKNKKQAEDKYPDLQIGYSNKSTTRFPKLYKPPAQSLPQQTSWDPPKYLMDSPGLFDTDGPQMEIVNRVLTVQFLQKIYELVIIVVINKSDLSSCGEKMTKLGKHFSELFTKQGDKSQIMNSVRFLINQADDKFVEELQSNIIDIENQTKKDNQRTTNQLFKMFFQKMKCSFGRNVRNSNRINPLTIKPQEFMDKYVAQDQKSLIQPNRYFQMYFSPQITRQITNVSQRCIKQIERFYKQGNVDAFNFYKKLIQQISQQKSLRCDPKIKLNRYKRELIRDFENEENKLKNKFRDLQDDSPKLKETAKKYNKLKEQCIEFQRKTQNAIKFFSVENFHQRVLDQIQNLNNYSRMLQKWDKLQLEEEKEEVLILEKQYHHNKHLLFNFYEERQQSQFTKQLTKLSQKYRQQLKQQLQIDDLSKQQPSDYKVILEQKRSKISLNCAKIRSICSINDQRCCLDDIQKHIIDSILQLKRKIGFWREREQGNTIFNPRKIKQNTINIRIMIRYLDLVSFLPNNLKTDQIKQECKKIKEDINKMQNMIVNNYYDCLNQMEQKDNDSDQLPAKQNKTIIKQIRDHLQDIKALQSITQLNCSIDYQSVHMKLNDMLKREFDKLVDVAEDFKQKHKILEGAKMFKTSLKKYRQLLQITQTEQQAQTNMNQQLSQIKDKIQQTIINSSVNLKLSLQASQQQIINIRLKYEKIQSLKKYLQLVCKDDDNIENLRKKKQEQYINIILQPIKNLAQRFQKRNILFVHYVKFISYCSAIQSEKMYFSNSLSLQYQEYQKTIKDKFRDFKDEKYRQLEDLKNILQRAALQDINVTEQNAYEQFKKYRQAFQLANLIQNCHKIQDQYQFQLLMEQLSGQLVKFLYDLQIKLEEQQNYKTLKIQKSLLRLLEMIDFKQKNQITNLLNKINQQIKKILGKDRKYKEQITVNNYKTLQDFEESIFILAYNSLQRSSSPASQKRQLLSCIKTIKKKFLILTVSQETLKNQLLMNLNIYFEKKQKILDQIKDQQLEKALKIDNLVQLFQKIEDSILKDYMKVSEDILKISETQIENFKVLIKQAENKLLYLMTFEKEYKREKINKYLGQRQKSSLSQDYQEKIQERQTIKEKFLSRDFSQLNEKNKYIVQKSAQKQQIQNSFKDYLQSCLKKLQNTYQGSYQEYQRLSADLQNKIKLLPMYSQFIEQKMRQMNNKIAQKDKIYKDKINNSLLGFFNFNQLKLITMIKEAMKNKKYLKIFCTQLTNKFDTRNLQVKDQQILDFQKLLHKQNFREIQQNQNLKRTLQGIQTRILTKKQSLCMKKIQALKNQGQIFNYSEDDSISSNKNSNKRFNDLSFIVKIYGSKPQNQNYFSSYNTQLGKTIYKQSQQFLKGLIQQIEKIIEEVNQVIKNYNQRFKYQDLFNRMNNLLKDVRVKQISHGNQLSKKLKISGKNLEDKKKELIDKVDQIHQQIRKGFIFYNEQVRTNSQKQDQKRIDQYQSKYNFLRKIHIHYNSMIIGQNQSIDINSIKEQVGKAIKYYSERFQSLINGQIQKIDLELSRQAIYIPKIVSIIRKRKILNILLPCHRFFQDLSEFLNRKIQLYSQSSQNNSQPVEQAQSSQREEINKLQRDYQRKIHQQNEELIKNIRNSQDDIDKKNQLERKSDQKIKQLRDQLDLKKRQISDNAELQQKQRQNTRQQQYIDDIGTKLIILLKLSAICLITEKCNEKIKKLFEIVGRNKKFVKLLYRSLEKRQSLLAARIIDQNSMFNFMKIRKFQQETQKTNSAKYVLDQMYNSDCINSIQRQNLQDCYKIFQQEQDKHINRYKDSKNPQVKNKLRSNIQKNGQILKKKFQTNQQVKPKERVQILAQIFAFWSILSIQAESGQDQDDDQIYCKAHAAQIISILLLICIDQNRYKQIINKNRLAEVKTGEGKSIVLAVLSIYFALLGYEVHCACYSEILSQRDERDFRPLFLECGVNNRIHYGIFEEIIKKVLAQKSETSEAIKFEDQIKLMLEQDSPSFLDRFKNFINKMTTFLTQKRMKQQKKILIIDEIDVLFDEQYLGETFNLSIDLRDQSITQFFKYLWSGRNNGITAQDIYNSSQFQKIVNKYPGLKDILKNQVHGMLGALKTYKQQKYQIIQKKEMKQKVIMYKVMDTYQEVNYRYNTVFSYLHEYDKVGSKISQSVLNRNLKICLCIAEFAYARLPKYYDNIVGVTGTLTCIPDKILDYLKDQYELETYNLFVIPSVYGKNIQNRQILNVIPCKIEQHISKIVDKINEYEHTQRPILVFFRNKIDLQGVYNSQEFRLLRQRTQCLTQQSSEQMRTRIIQSSSSLQRITFLTHAYTRGTDFKLINKKASQFGGFVGIVTYLIKSEIQYIQATGRVARQGKKGSYIEIIREDELKLIGIERTDQQLKPKFVQDQRRYNYKNQKHLDTPLMLQSFKKHEETQEMLKDFNKQKLIDYIKMKNVFPQISKTGRMVILLDATFSMQVMFTKLRQILPTVFQDVYLTLRQKNNFSCLEAKIVLYRNYNSPVNTITDCSIFSKSQKQLTQFIKNSKVDGGWGNEAIQKGLEQTNKVQMLNQIFLIGDAPGNTEQEIKYKSKKFLGTTTTTDKQLEKLIHKGVRISCVDLRKDKKAEDYFKRLSQSTRGQYHKLDLKKSNSAKLLTQWIVERALMAIGGGKNGAQLIKIYKSILEKRMNN